MREGEDYNDTETSGGDTSVCYRDCGGGFLGVYTDIETGHTLNVCDLLPFNYNSVKQLEKKAAMRLT